LAAEREELTEAAVLAAKAEEEATGSSDPMWLGRAQLVRATVLWRADDIKSSKRYFRRAITTVQKHDFRRELAEAYLRFGLFCGFLGERDGPGVHDPAAYWLAKAQEIFRDLGGLADLERVREAFRRFGRRATDRVAEVEVLQLLQELKQSRLTVQRSTERLAQLARDALPAPAEGADDDDRSELHDVEQNVARSLDDMALSEERFLAAVNAVVVERENIRSLIELTRTLSALDSYAAVTTRIAEMTARLTTGDRALVAVIGDGGELEVGAAYGIDPAGDGDWKAPVQQAALAKGQAELLVKAEERPGTATDARPDPRQQRAQRLRLGHAMVVPLRRGETVFGAIYVDKAITGGVFTDRDLDLLAVFAGQAGAILENQRIQEELRLAARASAATLDAATDAVVSIDTAGLITSYNATATRVLGIKASERRALRLRGYAELDFLASCLDRGEELDGRLVTVAHGEFLCNTRIIRDDAGDNVGLVATFTELKRAAGLAQRMVGSTARYSFGDLLGHSPVLKRRIALAEAAARSDSNVLITGESGTGKEVLAQAIHNASARAGGPFVAINCAAIPRDLLESELFGYESGAFTGARKGGRPGKFELAEGGTILLDEIGDMPLDMQAKLLRVLQERSSQRLGGTREITLNCRVVATTNRDLATEVARGLFRQDLFFRLRVIHVDLPPLRERPEDIEMLTRHFLQLFSARMGKQLTEVAPAVMDTLKRYPWPGNIRELEHVLEGEVNLAPPDRSLMAETPVMLEVALGQTAAMPMRVPVPMAAPPVPPLGGYYGVPTLPMGPNPVKTMHESERELLEAALVQHRGKIPAVARALGVSRGTVYNKMKKFNLDPDGYR
ncbi:MAG TPA: sigma 54-interacting transcriptional regulator, partial [Kofleriaceae bacterium]|nr:sigma 54-interacting transcriptional regulator [Kofleriaceae bacterium]